MIPKTLVKIFENDKRMQKCEYCGSCPVQWHHVFTYAGRQIQEYFSIAAACKPCHDKATPHKNQHDKKYKEFFEWKAIQRLTPQDIAKYPKKNWSMEAFYLNNQAKKYGWK